MPQQAPERRRRRSPEEAEREIVDAAEAFLREHPFRDLTIDEVMDGTGLSRPSFYVYFRDRHHLALRLIDEIGTQVYARTNRWLSGEGEPLAELRTAIEGTMGVYVEHGRVLRAIADSATEDAEVERAYRGVVDRFVEAATDQIEREVGRDRAVVADPRRTASALVWMTERVLTDAFGHGPTDDPPRVVDALVSVWSRAIYQA